MYNGAMVATVPEPWYVQTAQIVFYLTPVIVFLLTGGVAIWRFNIFRTAKPAIRIDLEVTSRVSSDSWNTISAVAMVTNTSRVRASCESLQWEVRVLAPYSDEEIENKAAEYAGQMVSEGPPANFPWNAHYRMRIDNPGIDLEPGESNVVDINLPVPSWIRAVDVRCTLVLPIEEHGRLHVWTSLCPHEIS